MLDKSFEEELQKVIGFYNDDFKNDILRVQLRTLPAVIGQSEASVNTHEYFVKQLKKPIRNLISEVVKMIKLVIVMLATNAVSECSFSAIHHLYNYLRTNMGSSRLNNAMVLHIINLNWTSCQWLMWQTILFSKVITERPCLEDPMMLI